MIHPCQVVMVCRVQRGIVLRCPVSPSCDYQGSVMHITHAIATEGNPARLRRIGPLPRKSDRPIRAIRLRQLAEDPRCRYCKVFLNEGTSSIDHIVPTSRGGSNDEGNLLLCCELCNSLKGDRTLPEWRKHLVFLVNSISNSFCDSGIQRALSHDGGCMQ